MPAAKGPMRCKRCDRPIRPEAPSRFRDVRCGSCGFTFRLDRASSLPEERELELRSDLVVAPVEEEGTAYFVIKDPRANRYFRVKPLEHFLITQFDGKTSLETIRRRASEEKKVLISEDVLSRFTDKFRDLGLLVRGEEEPPPREQRPLESVFHLKIPLAHPDSLLSWLYPKVRWTFSSSFAAAVAATILVACAVVVTNGEDLVFGFQTVVNLEGALFVLATITAVTILHELAHGLTCKHFGGRVADMGFLFLYFLPCFYCNLSDTYLFRERRQRLWVLFAGGYFELFLWAVAVLGWRVVAPGTLVSRSLFVVAAVCALRGLFNFNPLVKMDGYFMLSEYLGIENLRRQALSSLGRIARRLSGLDFEPAAPEILERRIFGMRGDRFLALFGGTALSYTALLVGGLVVYAGAFVFQSFGSDALAFYTVALFGLLHKPAITAASVAKDAGKEKWEKLGQEKKRFRFVVLWSGLALAVAVFPWHLRIPSSLNVLPQERQIVRAPSSGRISEIPVREGDRVEKGALILEYDTKELDLERKKKEGELEEARATLRMLEGASPTLQAEIKVKEQALKTAGILETGARAEFARSSELWTMGLVPKERFDKDERAFAEATARRQEAEADLELARKNPVAARLEKFKIQGMSREAQEQRIQQLEAELGQLDDLLSRTRIYASISGTLTTYRFQEKVGDFLEEGAEVCEIVNDDRVVVEMPVSEKDMDVVEIGREVKFKVRGYPARSFYGKVDEIAPVATPNGKSSAILVRAYVDNTDKLLKPGMTGVAKIYCGMSFVGNILTRDLIRFIRTEFWL